MRNTKNSISFNIRNITLNLENIISFYRNLIGHFTDKERILTLRFRNITLCLLILILSLVNITLCFSNYNNTSALDYSSNVGIGFTFNPTLSVSISPSDLIIDNLIPGSTLDSNSINVSVATNAAYGYTLSTNVGDDIHNNSNLTHTNNTDIFSSIATNADLASLDTDNTWGYTSKLNNETIWNNYNGLSSSSNAILLDNSNTADSTGSVDFKISAKASNTQPSGEYTGTINFYAITKPTPMNLAESYFAHGKTRYNGYYTMQDMTTDICNDTEVIGEGSQTELIDIRDNKVYWVTKLADNHCWMTQNLDLDLSHDRPLTSEDTDLNDGSLSGAYAENYTYDPETKIVTWTPKNVTYDHASGVGTPWSDNNYESYSFDPGKWYWSGKVNAVKCNYLVAHCEDFSQNPYSGIGMHGQIGNYYNWSSVIASDNSYDITTVNYDRANNDLMLNSVCPRAWRLPTISNQNNDFSKIIHLYDDIAGIISSPTFFVRSGMKLGDNISYSGEYGYYWSGNAKDYLAYRFNFDIKNWWSSSDDRYRGRSIRCLAR